jgi:hypothetical protein
MTTTEARSALQVSHFETRNHLILRRSLAAHGGVMSRRGQCNLAEGIEKMMTSTVLGMLMMMPVVFGVGGYALVSRRP